MGRNLASIQVISELHGIEGATEIECAKVLGWHVVVRKADGMKVGDKVVYMEIDSILPDRPEFEFLRERKFRIKTIKLRGQVSQGICFPLTILPPTTKIEEGMDVTDILGVEKYIPNIPEHLKGKVKGSFPSILPKTDETRVQVLQSVLTRWKGTQCYVSEKIPGCSITMIWRRGEGIRVCSRNLELEEDDGSNIFWRAVRQHDVEGKLINSGLEEIALQGEMYGEGIEGNTLHVEGVHIALFNAFNLKSYRYMDFNEFVNLCKQLGLETVPILETDFSLIDDVDELVKKSEGSSVVNPKRLREGIVIRPVKECVDLEMARGFGSGRVSFKVTSREYLLKYGC